MFCPQCGQQQVSNDVRFCSRCGFQLAAVTGLLTTGGTMPPAPPVYQATSGVERPESSRRRGVRKGTAMLLLGLVLTPVLAVIIESGAPDGSLEFLIPLSAIIFIFGGFLRMLYALIFEEGSLRRNKQADATFNYTPPHAPPHFTYQRDASALPQGQSIPARDYAPPRHTSDMYTPPSVTESTTRLLDEQPDKNAR